MKFLYLTILFSLFAFFAKAQTVDPAQVKAFLPFENSIENASASNAVFNPSTHADAVGTVVYDDGKFGMAGVFDVSPIVSSDLDFNSGEDFTISAWIYMVRKPSDLDGNSQVWVHQKDVEGQDPGRIHMEIMPEDYIGSFTGGIRCDDNTPIELLTWYHVANVQDVDQNERRLYVNGILVNSVVVSESNTGDIVVGGPKFEIGNGWQIREGSMIDDLLITGEVLTENQINEVMNNGVETAIATSVSEVSETAATSYYSNGTLYVQSANNGAVSKVEIVNLAGAKVFESTSQSDQYNVQLQSGIYIVRVTAGETVTTSKVSVL